MALAEPNSVVQLPRQHQPFPDQYICRLVYEQHARINPALSPSTVQTFNLNSVFDPDRSGTGHQPRGYDQLAALYDRYRVLAVDCEISVRQRETHGLMVTFLAANTATAQNGQYASENAYGSRPIVTSSNQPAVRWRHRFWLNDITGATPTAYMGDDRFQSQVTTSPSEVIVLQMVLESMDGATYVDCEYTARFTYLTAFNDRVIPGSSIQDRGMRLVPLSGIGGDSRLEADGSAEEIYEVVPPGIAAAPPPHPSTPLPPLHRRR